MNETMEVLMKRKSVRVFEQKDIPAEVKEAILGAAMRAPTAGNSMLYSILDITDQALKDKLAETCDHQPFIAAAPMVWVFLADYRRWVRKFQQAGCENVPAPPAQRPDSGHQRHGDRRPRRLRGRREPGGGLLLHRGHH